MSFLLRLEKFLLYLYSYLQDLLQKDIAKVLNISQVQYSRYETGLRLIPIDKLSILADFYHTSIDYLVDKVINLRIFDDESGVMNKSLLDVGGSILSISQFTLYADASKGRRPSYINALSGDLATKLYDEFNNKLKNKGINVDLYRN